MAINGNKKNISSLEHCYGCGVCTAVCPVKIISLRENNEGFYSPVIDNQDKCINCGLCLKVCAFNHAEVSEISDDPAGYAGWSNTPAVRRRCSSGGIGFELGRLLIEKGYKAIGARYNPETEKAEHFIAGTVEEFLPSIGSKYIQSYTADAFAKIKKGEKYFVTGTPCQIDSFRRYIRLRKIEDNFILMDFFCHGVPSMLVWEKYLAELKPEIGRVLNIAWRSKLTGWQDSYSIISHDISDTEPINWDDDTELAEWDQQTIRSSRKSEGDLFFKFFLSDDCLNTCCYKSCKYKMCSSAADIRIGDFWGPKYSTNQQGVSGVMALTDKGKELIGELRERCELIPEQIREVTSGQMPHNPHKPLLYDKIMSDLRRDKSLCQIADSTLKMQWYLHAPEKVIKRIKQKLKH